MTTCTSPPKVPSSVAPLELLGDEVLGNICSHLDFQSANLFATGVSRKLAVVLQRQDHLWKSLHQRLGFANDFEANVEAAVEGTTNAILRDTIERYKYSQVLLQNDRSKTAGAPTGTGTTTVPSAIPSTAWFFVPLSNEADVVDEDSLPPLTWVGHHAVSLLGGTSPQLLLMNPWTHRLTLRKSLLQGAIPLDHDASSLPETHATRGRGDGGERKRPRPTANQPEAQLLLDSSPEALNMDDLLPPSQYPGLEIDIRDFGLEVHSRHDASNGMILGYELSLVRRIETTKLNSDTNVMEAINWFLPQDFAVKRSEKRSVRIVDSGVGAMVVCSSRQVLYTNAWDSNADDDSFVAASTIEILSLLNTQGHTQVNINHTARPLERINIGERVRCFEFCASFDRMIVCTNRNTLQVWNVEAVKKSYMEQSVEVLKVFSDVIKRLDSASSAISDLFPAQETFVAKRRPIQISGFVTSHFQRNSDCRVLLWKRLPVKSISMNGCFITNYSYQIVSMIDLPVTSSRRPEIHFDGRKLIVYSEDHIGYLVLIYQVRLSGDDDSLFSSSSYQRPGTQGDGNVYNFTTTPFVRFAKRIRHATLGGLESWESLHMSCNDRFLIFNSRRDLNEGDAGPQEGLIVIDLKSAVTPNLSHCVHSVK